MEKCDHLFLGHFSPLDVGLDLQELVANWQLVATILQHPPACIMKQIQQMEKRYFQIISLENGGLLWGGEKVQSCAINDFMSLILFNIKLVTCKNFSFYFQEDVQLLPHLKTWGHLKKSPVFLLAFCWL